MSESLQEANDVLSFAFPFPFFCCEEREDRQGDILSLLLSLKAFHGLEGCC